MNDDLFDILAVGFGQWEMQNFTYPYPGMMQHGINMLAARMIGSYPTTVMGLVHLMEQPLNVWWRWELPKVIDPRFSLLTDGRLDEQILEYLFTEDLQGPAKSSLEHLVIHNDNKKVADLVEKARYAYQRDPGQAELDYEEARRFLIEHPITTPEEFHNTLYRSPFMNELREMYQEIDTPRSTIYASESDQGALWCCPVCGVLRNERGSLQSLKPSVCLLRCPGNGNWQRIELDENIRVLRAGIQLRTMIPGVVELHMYDWLGGLHDENRQLLTQVSLWPGIDRYDIRISFGDRDVWAIDIKDYRSPLMLGKEISQASFYREEERISWKRAIYIIPADREDNWPGYLDIARNALGKKPRALLMTTRHFEDEIRNKIAELR